MTITTTTTTISLTVNGAAITLDVDPTKRLSDVLRYQLKITGTKVGCDAGDCGACSVLIDDQVACACLVPAAQADGTNIQTVEGLTDSPKNDNKDKDANNTLSQLQQSFLHHGAAQCGICTPGMLMSAKALLDTNKNPTRTEVEDALGGVLCRCTGYQKIIDAVVNTPAFNGEINQPESGKSVGASILHLDGAPKVNGKLNYGADNFPVGTLFLKIIRSPYHHAQFTITDSQKYIDSRDGLELFMCAADVPGNNYFGVIEPFADQPVFAVDTARFRGEAVAAIVGTAEALAAIDEDIKAYESTDQSAWPIKWPIKWPIEWKELPYSLLPEEATAADSEIVHKNRPGNILVKGYVERGDATEALQRAAFSVTTTTSTPFIEHAYIEPEAGFCKRNGHRLEIYGCTQAAHMDRESLAAIMNLPLDSIRIMPSACGGGFGAKLDISFQPYIAMAAWILNKPVGINYTRGDSMRSTTKRHPSNIELTVGCDSDGMLCGFDFTGTFNTGAYASWGPTVANRVPVHASGPYYTPDYCARSVAVHTHTAPSGAFRGFGVPQSAVAQETAFDQLADLAGIDRLTFRIQNALRNGQPTVTGQVFNSGVGIVECLEALEPSWKAAIDKARQFNTSAKANHLRKGVGIGTCWYGCGNTSLPNPSTVRMGITSAGRVILHQGAMDIGQGSNTVITQIAADAVGLPVHTIELVDGDTDLTPDCGKTSASRQTFVTGMAAKLAGETLRAAILRLGNVSADALIEIDGPVINLIDGSASVALELAKIEANEFGYAIMAEESYNPPTTPLNEQGQGTPYAVYGYGAQLMELTVDTRLGTVKLDHITAAHDVGKAINPMLVEAQIEGGVAQGIGLALMEEYLPGRTENLHDYLIPTIGDMPEFSNIIIEVADAEGPYGAKGLGEHVLIPTAPAILNAIRDATGALVTDLPATPHKVLAAINSVR